MILDAAATLSGAIYLTGWRVAAPIANRAWPGRKGRHRRARIEGGMVSAPGVEAGRLLAMTDARTGTAHLVTDEAAAAGRRTGRYATVCGGEVLAASLTEPERSYCRGCADWRAGR